MLTRLPDAFGRPTLGATCLPQTPDTAFAGPLLEADEMAPVLPVLRPSEGQALGYQRLVDAVA